MPNDLEEGLRLDQGNTDRKGIATKSTKMPSAAEPQPSGRWPQEGTKAAKSNFISSSDCDGSENAADVQQQSPGSRTQ
jgi:hypothetical protein